MDKVVKLRRLKKGFDRHVVFFQDDSEIELYGYRESVILSWSHARSLAKAIIKHDPKNKKKAKR
jgi:hypothetical protein